jgi:hypothetical protein
MTRDKSETKKQAACEPVALSTVLILVTLMAAGCSLPVSSVKQTDGMVFVPAEEFLMC